jgi:hypothetical protein
MRRGTEAAMGGQTLLEQFLCEEGTARGCRRLEEALDARGRQHHHLCFDRFEVAIDHERELASIDDVLCEPGTGSQSLTLAELRAALTGLRAGLRRSTALASAPGATPSDRTTLWYSARVRAVVLEEGNGAIDLRDSVFVFRAPESWDVALRRAIELGRARLESEYVNMNGKRVRWRVCSVLTLDQLTDQEIDGAEVWTEGRFPEDPNEHSFDQVFEPASIPPEHSGV